MVATDNSPGQGHKKIDEQQLATASNNYGQVIKKLDRECREQCNGRAELEIKELIGSQANVGDVVVYSDGSVTQGQRSSQGFSMRVRDKVSAEKSSLYQVIISGMRMEIDAVNAALS